MLISLGVDLNHNPEFTTCEFYRTYADVEELINITEKLVTQLYEFAKTRVSQQYRSLKLRSWDLRTPFNRLDFIPALEAAIAYIPPTLDSPAQTEIKRRLPDLSSPDAERGILQLLQDLNIPQPAKPTLPRLLDRLSSIYLERDIRRPTFITNHPECLSPLSKSFIHPANGQRVAARAELFVYGLEIANMYEEENSPFEQRRKFVQQLSWKDDGNPGDINENYLEALEWGLPPTGGWGCGLDRLCMLLAGTSRIADVLAFGTLRNVVALGPGGAQGSRGYEGSQVSQGSQGSRGYEGSQVSQGSQGSQVFRVSHGSHGSGLSNLSRLSEL
jgi:lysyl-tRNA synthetase class 2